MAHNPADRLAAKPIDDYRYDRAHHCYRRPSRGANAMVAWLGRNARGQFWGIMRCERLSRDSMSLHSEGRAIDWHLDASSAADRRAARRLILTLLATDRAGNPHALARRMGVQEIIWELPLVVVGRGPDGARTRSVTRARASCARRWTGRWPTATTCTSGSAARARRMRTSFWRR